MHNENITVEEYLMQVSDDRRHVLQQLRTMCQHELKDYRESMSYGMPTYANGKKVEVAFGSQKKFITVYFLKPGFLQQFAADLNGHDTGKSCIRFKKPASVDFELLQKLLRSTVNTEDLVLA